MAQKEYAMESSFEDHSEGKADATALCTNCWQYEKKAVLSWAGEDRARAQGEQPLVRWALEDPPGIMFLGRYLLLSPSYS